MLENGKGRRLLALLVGGCVCGAAVLILRVVPEGAQVQSGGRGSLSLIVPRAAPTAEGGREFKGSSRRESGYGRPVRSCERRHGSAANLRDHFFGTKGLVHSFLSVCPPRLRLCFGGCFCSDAVRHSPKLA